MMRDLEEGVAERIEAWAESAGRPALQPLEFIDGGDAVLVCAAAVGEDRVFWFTYTMDGPRIAGWEAFDDEKKARKAAGLSA
jgi:hypothetical protein